MSFGDTQYKDKPDMASTWLRHMDRVNMTSGNSEGGYAAYVRQQFRLLPGEMRDWVMSQSDVFTEKKNVFVFENPSGFAEIGSVEAPALRDEGKPVKRLKDESIDWSDPNIWSPKLKVEEVIDYEMFNLLVMAASEKAGLSWNIKVHTYDNGDVTDEMKNKKKQPPHPIRMTSSGKKYSDTPPGSNMNVISTISGTALDIVDWHGTQVLQGPGYSPIFFDAIQARTNKENGTIIGMGGGPGEGKTWFGVRLGELLNRVKPSRSFNPYIQMPFTQEQFLWLLSDETPLVLGDVIILDEAHFAAGARNWFKEDQKELVDLIATARNMGFIIILIVLHIDMLDKILRQFTMAFYVHLEEPGHATAYRTFTPRFNNEMMKNTIGPVTLQIPGIGRCDHPRCLHCKHLNPDPPEASCPVNRAIYERRKRHFQTMKVEQSLERRKEKAKQENTPDITKIMETLDAHKDKLMSDLTEKKRIKPERVAEILLNDLKYDVKPTKAKSYRDRYELRIKSKD